MRRWMILVLLVPVVICALAVRAFVNGAAPGVPSPPSNASQLSPADAAAVRRVAMAYWQAYNDYDVDATLALLEPTYRASREATIRNEIGQIKTFGVKLGVSEKTAPIALGPDTAEMYVTLSQPLGASLIRMDFVRTGGGWLITFAEQVN